MDQQTKTTDLHAKVLRSEVNRMKCSAEWAEKIVEESLQRHKSTLQQAEQYRAYAKHLEQILASLEGA